VQVIKENQMKNQAFLKALMILANSAKVMLGYSKVNFGMIMKVPD
jgi:hypothetical protein